METRSLRDDHGIKMISDLLQMAIPGSDLTHLDQDASEDANVSNAKKITLTNVMQVFNSVRGLTNDQRLQDMSRLASILQVDEKVLQQDASSKVKFPLGMLLRVLLGIGSYSFNFRKISILLGDIVRSLAIEDKDERIKSIVQSFFTLIAEDLSPEVSEAFSNFLPTILSTK